MLSDSQFFRYFRSRRGTTPPALSGDDPVEKQTAGERSRSPRRTIDILRGLIQAILWLFETIGSLS